MPTTYSAAERRGPPWTKSEDYALLTNFTRLTFHERADVSDIAVVLSDHHQRSEGGIYARLKMLLGIDDLTQVPLRGLYHIAEVEKNKRAMPPDDDMFIINGVVVYPTPEPPPAPLTRSWTYAETYALLFNTLRCIRYSGDNVEEHFEILAKHHVRTVNEIEAKLADVLDYPEKQPLRRIGSNCLRTQIRNEFMSTRFCKSPEDDGRFIVHRPVVDADERWASMEAPAQLNKTPTLKKEAPMKNLTVSTLTLVGDRDASTLSQEELLEAIEQQDNLLERLGKLTQSNAIKKLIAKHTANLKALHTLLENTLND